MHTPNADGGDGGMWIGCDLQSRVIAMTGLVGCTPSQVTVKNLKQHRCQNRSLSAVVMQVATLMPAVAEGALPAATALALETLERSLSTSNRCLQNLTLVPCVHPELIPDRNTYVS